MGSESACEGHCTSIKIELFTPGRRRLSRCIVFPLTELENNTRTTLLTITSVLFLVITTSILSFLKEIMNNIENISSLLSFEQHVPVKDLLNISCSMINFITLII